MIDADETFDGTWPFAPHFFDGHGFRQHYVIEGEGDPILLLHDVLAVLAGAPPA